MGCCDWAEGVEHDKAAMIVAQMNARMLLRDFWGDMISRAVWRVGRDLRKD